MNPSGVRDGASEPSGSGGLGPFFSRLERALDALDAGGLADRVREYARRLGPAERQALLAVLEAGPAPTREPAHALEDRPHPDEEADRLSEDPLLREIDAFVGRLEEGHYYQGWGWDPDLHDERVWGDESWADEMDDLFADAENVYLDGELGLEAVADADARPLPEFGAFLNEWVELLEAGEGRSGASGETYGSARTRAWLLRKRSVSAVTRRGT